MRQWTAPRLSNPATLGFLRIRNREEYDVYFRPHAGDRNAGYILLDLDHLTPGILARLRAQGHDPCVVVETSPGRWQAWIRVSPEPPRPALATHIAKRLAQIYEGDRASADWRHLGRLAGLTNRKPRWCQADGLAPWVKLTYARACLARDRVASLDLAAAELAGHRGRSAPLKATLQRHTTELSTAGLDPTALQASYRDCLNRMHIPVRYPAPDWSIADRWVAREHLEAAQLLPWSPGSSVRAAQAFHGAIPTPTITFAGLSAAPLCFPARPTVGCSTDPPAARAVCTTALRDAWDTRFCLHTRVSYPSLRKTPQTLLDANGTESEKSAGN